jgi:Ca2+-binding RTX toxin-like protein
MTTRTVPTQFATIASADTASSNGDTIALVNGYSNETATLTHNLTVNGDATDTGIVLIMGTGVTSVTLTGTAPITVNDNAGNDSITGNAGNDIIKVAGGQDTVDGGTGNDRLIVNYSGDASGVDMGIALVTGTSDGYHGQYNDNTGNLVTFDNINNFTITTGGGADTIATGSGNDVVSLGAGNDFIDSGTGVDQIDGGAGNDGWAADMSSATQGIAIDLTALTPSTFLGTGSVTGIEYLGGPSGVFKTGSGNDTIVTTAGNFTDNISTGAGNDTITVAGGNDTVDGGTGNDRLIVNYSTDVNLVDMGIALATGTSDVLGITGGAPNDADATLTYQWQRDGSNITANGTGSTYTVAEADETHALQVVVTSHDTDASSTTTTSNATSAVTDNSSLAVSLDSVTANAGQTLNATAVRGAPSASAAGCAANDSRTPAGRLAEAPVHLRRSARESCLHLPRDSAKNKTGTHQVREPA